jgi:hypothetical protein
MTVPQPVRFVRTDHPSVNPGAGQHLGIPNGEVAPVAEYRVNVPSGLFHVKPSSVESLSGEHHDATMWLFTVTLAAHTFHCGHRVVHDLPLERGHGL